ncbi:MAG: hypothetical protein MRZ79_17690, partial [Bacteroidia bacterium]|nr:hypothetical protein [Bacteroidia bacterium]
MNFSKTQFFSLGLLLIGLLATMTAFGANFTSVQNGSWDDPATWDLNAVPTVNDNVTITSAHAVTTTAITISFNDLTLEGTLELGTFTQTNVQKTIVNSSGTITATNRIFIAEDVDMGSNIVLNAGGQLDYRDYDFTGINGTPTITVNSGASFFLTSFANVPHTMSNIDVVNFGFFGKTGGSVGPNAGDHII